MTEQNGSEGRSEFDRTVEGRMAHRVVFNVPGRGNAKLRQLIERVNEDDGPPPM